MNKIFQSGRALLIGISEYESLGYLGMEPLNDVDDFAKILTSTKHCGYPFDNVQVLRNAGASREIIIGQLQKLSAEAQDGDTVVIYFSGHGAQRLSGPEEGTYLCPPEFDSSRPRETGIEAEEFSGLLKNIPAERLLVLIDACHSGAAARIKGKTEDVTKWAFGGPKLEALAKGKGRVIISASAEGEYSYILAAHRNSLFTHFLLKGLQGEVDDRKDGLIHVLDLFHYLASQVPTARAGQHPVLTTHTQDNFPVALRNGGRIKSDDYQETASTHAEIDSSSVNLQSVEKLLVSLYPLGPLDQEIWSRAGGDIASLRFGGNARASWHSALKQMSQGGGGDINLTSLLNEVKTDFKNNPELNSLLGET